MQLARISSHITSIIVASLLAACSSAGNQVLEPKLAEPLVTSSSTSAALRLANEGGAPLSFEVTSSDARVVVTPQKGSLEASKARTLEVSATCEKGTVTSDLTITSNDAANPVKTIPLTLTCGAVEGPVWWLSADTLTVNAHGDLSVQQEVVKKVTLSNSGRVKGAYTLSSTQDWLSAARTSGTLDAGEKDELELLVRPCTEPKRGSAELHVEGSGASASLTVVRDCDAQNAATLDLKFERFYINQAVPAADSQRPPHERRALVASRGGLARAFIHANQVNDQEVTVRLHYKNTDGEGYLDLSGPASAPTQADEGDLSSTFNAMLDEALITPGLSIAVEIDPENEITERNEANNRYPASGFVSLSVTQAPALNLTLVPVTYGGNTPTLSKKDQDDLLEQTRLMYPLSDVNVTVRAPYTFSGRLGVTNKQGKMESSDKGWNDLLSQLTNLRTLDGSTDLYYGVVDPGYSSGIAGMGWVGGKPVSVGWNRASTRSKVMAHELGHNWNRSHAPCKVDGDRHYPHGEGKIGVWGFDKSTRTLKEPSGHADIMGYCNPAWISDYTYDGILEHRQNHAFNIQSQSLPTDALIVSGSVERGALTLNPVFRAKAVTDTPTPGPYTLVGTDSAGRTLFSVPFSTLSVADALTDSLSGFNLALPLSEEEARDLVSLRVERGSKVLAEQGMALRTQSAQKTEVKRANGKVTLTWDASAYDAVIVRDAQGNVLAMDESGEVVLETQSSALKLTFSDGLRSHEEVLTF